MLAGVRYIFIGKAFERRPSYHVLGVLLFLQLAATTGSWTLSLLAEQLTSEPAAAGGGDAPLTSKAQHAIVLKVREGHGCWIKFPSSSLDASSVVP